MLLSQKEQTLVISKPSQTRQQRDLFLVSLTVVLFYLAFPSSGYGYLSWIALVPLIIALHNSSSRYAFSLGLLAATFGWMASIWWTVGSIAKVANSHYSVVIPFVFLVCILSALPYAIATWLLSRYQWSGSTLGAIKSAAVFTALVNFVPQILPGNLVHSLYQSPRQIQLADIGGVPLVFFVIHLVNFLIANAIIQIKSNLKITRISFILALSIWLANWTYGSYRLDSISKLISVNTQKELTVAMIQPDFAITKRERKDWLASTDQLSQLIKHAINQELPIDLIVLPELPTPISYRLYQYDKTFFNQLINDIPLVYAGIYYNNEKNLENLSYFNTLELIQNQQLIQHYQKQKLVPLAEYLPFEEKVPFLRTLFPNAPRYQPGEQTLLLPLKKMQSEINLIPLICYEAVFTEIVSKGVNVGGDILLNAVNDAWFDDTEGRRIHFALALFRAIEYRMPMIRVTNNGISAIIDASGSILTASVIPSFKSGYSITDIPVIKIDSFYKHNGYFFMLICCLFCIYVLLPGKRNFNEKYN